MPTFDPHNCCRHWRYRDNFKSGEFCCVCDRDERGNLDPLQEAFHKSYDTYKISLDAEELDVLRSALAARVEALLSNAVAAKAGADASVARNLLSRLKELY